MELIVKRFDELRTEELYALLKTRVAVFVVEQHCPYQEIDGKDLKAYHVMLLDEGAIAAYVRVLDKGVSYPEASIGRVLTIKRKRGYGDIVMKEGIRIARDEFKADKIRIEAQSYARGFYERFGFQKVSDEFLEDDIPHIEMLLEI